MKSIFKHVFALLLLALLVSAAVVPACAAGPGDAGEAVVTAEAAEAATTSAKAWAAALAIGLAAGAGAIGMGIAIAKAADGISRQPEADGKIRTALMLGLVFVETAIIYALIVAILIIFVL
ncbi:MAG: ATP synthase F0 subunit C [Oscillibacter sp.]|nr:ATP synthase F0 subunit C [Oscillibacter sp.]